MNKKLLAMGLSVSMIAGMLTGCGNASDDAQASTQPATQQTTAGQTSDSGDEPITLRFSWWGGDERNAATLDVIEQFEQLHPNVTIEAEYGGNDGYHDKLATQLASGTAADIVQVDPEIFPQYVNTGDYFIDYQDYSNMDLSTFDENYISLEINGRYDGKQLCGKTLFDIESGQLNITEEQMKQVMEYVQKLYDEEVVAPASYQAAYSGDNLQSDANWIAGKYVCALTYISTIDVMVAANDSANYTMSQLPMLDGCTEAGWASNTPQVIAITKTCEHPEMAVEFMNYFFNNETALATLGATRSVPPTENARKICSENGKLSEVTMEGANIAAAAGGTPNDKISSSEESKTILFDAVETIGYGATTPDAAASEIIDSLSSL